MKLLFALFGLLVAAETAPHKDVEEWNLFKITRNKNNTTDAEDKFILKVILDCKKYDKGIESHKPAMNRFGGMLHKFTTTLNALNKTKKPRMGLGDEPLTFIEPANAKGLEFPESVDWRKKGAVTPVKNQGDNCNCSWAFSAIGALEGQMFRETGKLVSLSEQNLVDCSGGYGNHGCSGGSVTDSYWYIANNQGIDTESSYPYEGKDGPCRYRPDRSAANALGYSIITKAPENHLKEAVFSAGPISALIDASHQSFQSYSGGVYFEPQCSSTNLNHAVLVVGYGTDEDGTDYWLVKNSWGESWGEEGYIRMARNRDNNCGIASSATYPILPDLQRQHLNKAISR